MISGVMMVGGAVAAHVGAAAEAGAFLLCRDRAIAAAGRSAGARGIAPGLPDAAGAQCARRPGRADPGRSGLHRSHRPRSQQASRAGRQRAPDAATARAGPASRRGCQARGCPGGRPRPAEATAAAGVRRQRFVPSPLRERRERGMSRPRRRRARRRDGRRKQEARAAEESGAAERAGVAEAEAETGKGAPKKRPAKREPSPEERRPVSGKDPTGPSRGPTPGPLPAPEGVSLRSIQIWQFDRPGRRDRRYAPRDRGRFIAEPEWGSLGEKRPGGAQKGDWAPFEGFYRRRLVKPRGPGRG